MAMENGHPVNGAYTLAAGSEPMRRSSAFSSARSSSPVGSNPFEEFAPIRTTSSSESDKEHGGADLNEDGIARTISRRRSYASGHEAKGEEWAQIEKLISRMFGSERKANSEDEKTRHVGVVWRNLTVKGAGLGSALQPTNADIFLGLPRLIKQLLTKGRKGTGAGKSIRTILDDFTVGVNSDSRGRCD
jgi:ATP-binding cassette subfamily G (WHITE) protein 2 (SNQ2)